VKERRISEVTPEADWHPKRQQGVVFLSPDGKNIGFVNFDNKITNFLTPNETSTH